MDSNLELVPVLLDSNPELVPEPRLDPQSWSQLEPGLEEVGEVTGLKEVREVKGLKGWK